LSGWVNEVKIITRAFSLVAFVAVLLLAGGVAAATSGVTVNIDAPAQASPDSDFTAAISISQVTGFDACNYDVTFDPSVLRLDDVTSGLIGSTTVPVDIYNEISSGTYRVIQNVPGVAGVSGSGYLAELHFHVIGAEGDRSLVGPSNGVLSDITAGEIEAAWVEGIVMVATVGGNTQLGESTGPAPLLPPPPPASGTDGVPVLWLVIGGAVLLGIIILFLVARSRAY
jgi:hypothetical protein